MSLIAVVARLRSVTSLPEDDCVNVYHFQTGSAADFDTATAGVADAYMARLDAVLGGVNQVTVSAYDLANPVPRPPQNVEVRSLTARAVMPREVACCLSFFADRNLPRNRGRVFIGPFASAFTEERPGATVRGAIADFAGDLGDIGPDVPIPGLDNVDWSVYSRADTTFKEVTDWWIDNAWDTMRSRGNAPTSRLTGTV